MYRLEYGRVFLQWQFAEVGQALDGLVHPGITGARGSRYRPF